jgi:hypothetical protein
VGKIGFFYGDAVHMAWNSSYWRCQLPAKALTGHEVVLAHVNTLPSHADCDVFFVERCLFEPYLSFLKTQKAKGSRVYCTFDDNFALFPKFLPGYPLWKAKHTEFIQGLGEIDGGLCPSQLLVDYYSRYGNIKLVENYYPDSWYDEPVNPTPEFELGISCSISHMESIKHSKILEALKQSDYSLLFNAGQAHQLMDMMQGLYSEYSHWTRQQDYTKIVDRFAVGLAPLAGEYDRYRSNIKCLLYNVRGRPFVASRLDPYFKMFGGVLVDNTVKGWLEGIEKVLKDYKLYADLGREQALNYKLSENIYRYQELIG